MKNDLASVLKRIAKFIGKEIPEDKMPELLHHLSFEQMKKNDAVNKNDYVEVKHNTFNMKIFTFLKKI